MSDDQDGCEWVFILVPTHLGSPGPMAVKRFFVCVISDVLYCWKQNDRFLCVF